MSEGNQFTVLDIQNASLQMEVTQETTNYTGNKKVAYNKHLQEDV